MLSLRFPERIHALLARSAMPVKRDPLWYAGSDAWDPGDANR